MFDRRVTRSALAKLRQVVWPSMGWQRAAAYYWHRLQRVPGTPESIVAGFACGAAASMMPLMGLHFVLAALFALAVRGSVIASAFGTVVGNPWTFPFIWLGAYKLGTAVLGAEDELVGERPFRTMFAGLTQSIRTLDGTKFVESVWPIWWPMMVGSIPLAIAAGVLTYWLLVPPARAAHRRRAAAIAKRAQQTSVQTKADPASQE
jgi:uncharacterized protein (DUF2062 family)